MVDLQLFVRFLCQTWLLWNPNAAGLIKRVLLHHYVCSVVFHVNLRRVSSTPSVFTQDPKKDSSFQLSHPPCISPIFMIGLELTSCMSSPSYSCTYSRGPHLRFVSPFFGILESAGYRFFLYVPSLVSRVFAPLRPHSIAACKTALR
jgi:hypothetical protein